MRIQITVDSNNAKAQLRKWAGEFNQRSRAAAVRALSTQAREIKTEVREHVSSRMKVVKRSFLSGFSAKVYDRDKNRLPALLVSSKIPWAGMHEFGGSISGKMLIPLHGRVGRKAFKLQIDALMRGGNAYFVKNAKGNVVLMAENIKEHDRPLRGFKSRYRKAEGIKRLKRGADIPIAVLVPRVTLKKRINVEALTAARIPRIAAEIENELGRLA